METRKYLAGENLSNRFCSSTYVVVVVAFDVEVCPSIAQKLARRLCRSLPVDRAFRLTVSRLLASMMPRPVIDLMHHRSQKGRQPE